jgi:hypothetical protein
MLGRNKWLDKGNRFNSHTWIHCISAQHLQLPHASCKLWLALISTCFSPITHGILSSHSSSLLYQFILLQHISSTYSTSLNLVWPPPHRKSAVACCLSHLVYCALCHAVCHVLPAQSSHFGAVVPYGDDVIMTSVRFRMLSGWLAGWRRSVYPYPQSRRWHRLLFKKISLSWHSARTQSRQNFQVPITVRTISIQCTPHSKRAE